MNASILKNYLLPILHRRQELQRKNGLAAIYLIAFVTGILLFGLQYGMGEFSPAVLLAWLGGTIAAAWLFNRSISLREPEYQTIVARIEEAHPELNALLKTAIEQTPEGENVPLNFLQERVIKEAIDHAVAHQWIKLVPNRALDPVGI